MIKKIILLTFGMLSIFNVNIMANNAKLFFKPISSLISTSKFKTTNFATYTKKTYFNAQSHYYKNMATSCYLTATYPSIITSLVASAITATGIYLIEKK